MDPAGTRAPRSEEARRRRSRCTPSFHHNNFQHNFIFQGLGCPDTLTYTICPKNFQGLGPKIPKSSIGNWAHSQSPTNIMDGKHSDDETGIDRAGRFSTPLHACPVASKRPHMRPISVLRLWNSEGLTQA